MPTLMCATLTTPEKGGCHKARHIGDLRAAKYVFLGEGLL